jgi:hypothetical protein
MKKLLVYSILSISVNATFAQWKTYTIQPDTSNLKQPIADTTSKPTQKIVNDKLNYRGIFTFGGILGFPNHEFGQIHDGIGSGFHASCMINPFVKQTHQGEKNNWFASQSGLYFQYLRLGKSTETSSRTGTEYNSEVETKISNNTYALGLVSRIEFLPAPFRLFVEGFAGYRWYNSKYGIEITYTENPDFTGPYGPKPDDYSDSKSLTGGVVSNYGWGAGIATGKGGINLELKVSQVYGGKVNYVDPESVTFNHQNNTYDYTTKTSTTDLFLVSLGLIVRL